MRTDPAWLGRAFAVSMSFNFLGYPVGALIGGMLVALGTNLAIGVAIGVTLIGAGSSWALIPADAPAVDGHA